jgi:hypothetical protein
MFFARLPVVCRFAANHRLQAVIPDRDHSEGPRECESGDYLRALRREYPLPSFSST